MCALIPTVTRITFVSMQSLCVQKRNDGGGASAFSVNIIIFTYDLTRPGHGGIDR